MSLATQVTNPYFDGMTLTGAILQSEFSTLIAKVNNLDNDNINATAGILITKTELGASGRSASDIGLQNTKKLIFRNVANSDDSSIYEDASNNVTIKIGTAGQAFVVRGSALQDAFNVDTTALQASARTGYSLAAYESANVKNINILHNGTDGQVNASAGALLLTGSPIYCNSSVFGNGTNTYSLGSLATDWKDVFGQNAYTTVSDAREKRDIQTLDKNKSIALMRGINNVDYLWNDFEATMPKRDEDGNIMVDENGNQITELVPQTHHRRHSGWIAQQVKEVMDTVGIDSEDFAGYIEDTESGKLALRQGEFIPHLLNYVQSIDERLTNAGF